MEQSYIERKCNCCKEVLVINNDNIDDAIYYDKNFYHSSCFIEKCTKLSKSQRKNTSPKWGIALKNLDNIKHDSSVYIHSCVAKESIFDFIRKTYGISNVPPYIFEKLSRIYTGTFKGMSIAIPPEHLLDMWQRKMNMLNRIFMQNIAKGNKMAPEARINYDLSVLIGKYDSYLRWLEQKKVLEAEKDMNRNENIVMKSIGYNTQRNNEFNTNDDISDLVNDIFG